jgi:transposase
MPNTESGESEHRRLETKEAVWTTVQRLRIPSEQEGSVMPQERLSMRKIREVLRLKWGQALSNRAIATACQIGVGTVHEYVRRCDSVGLRWPLPDGLTDEEIEARLFPPPPSGDRPQPDFDYITRELRRKGVTLNLLWEEYRKEHPNGYGRTQFCELYRCHAAKLDPRMRQVHKAGEKVFVDYAGMTIGVVDPSTGEIREAQVFVASLGASDYTYVEATWGQTLPEWISSHVRAFEFFGGVPEIVVPDNLKSGVTSACFYEPDLNPSYLEMADYYNVAVIPARVLHPRDKAIVENHVKHTERRILAPLRNRRFIGLGECNRTIAELLTDLNARAFQQLPGSRRTMFEELDRPALRPLPEHPYSFGLWKKARVANDYHVSVERSFYSVHYTLLRKEVDVRISERVVEIFLKGQRVASHPRSDRPNAHSTLREHMPKSHAAYAEWTPERIVRWAGETGGATAEVVTRIMATRAHPQQGFRSCQGIIALGKTYGPQRLEAACVRALAIGGINFKVIRNILQNKLDQQPLPTPETRPSVRHRNLREPGHFGHERAAVANCVALTLDFDEPKGN